MEHLYTPADIEESRTWALNRATEIQNKLVLLQFEGEDPNVLFPAKPEAGHCRYCAFVSECQKVSEINAEDGAPPLVAFSGDDLNITSLEEAEKMGAEFLRLKAASDKITEALKVFCQATGQSVIVGDQEYASYESVSWSFTADQKKELAAAMAEAGVNPWEIVALGTTQLKSKKLEVLGWDEKSLSTFGGKKKTSTGYRWRKATQENHQQKEDKNVSSQACSS